jgi:MFS superfamily sulfate permease-like transporter
MCQRKKYKIDEQQELYAMSGAHLFTGFFPSFPTTNGLGRAMVIDACGATSQVGFWLLGY